MFSFQDTVPRERLSGARVGSNGLHSPDLGQEPCRPLGAVPVLVSSLQLGSNRCKIQLRRANDCDLLIERVKRRIELVCGQFGDQFASSIAGIHEHLLIRSGQIVRVRLTRRVLKNIIMVPLLAVIPMEDAKAVYVVEAGKAERREVKLGFLKGRSVLIRDGLRSGDQLIIAGHRYVGPGQPVRVTSEE